MANATRQRTHVLTELETREVSLVDVGANKKRFCFRKNDGGENMDPEELKELLSACIDTPMEGEEAIIAHLEKAGYDKRSSASIRAAIKLLNAHQDVLQPSHKAALGKLAATSDDEDDDEDDDSGRRGRSKSGGPDLAKMSPEVREHFEQIAKAREADRAEMVRLRKAMQERDDADQLRVCVAKAEKEFSSLPGPDKIGAMLHKAAKAGIRKELEDTLRAANERAKMGGTKELTKQRGTSADWGSSEGQSAEARLQALTIDIAKARGIASTVAFVKACEENPELYEAYETERKQRARAGG